MGQQEWCWVSYLAESKLKLKEGTHKAWVNTRCSDNLMTPMWVIGTSWPFGSLTW